MSWERLSAPAGECLIWTAGHKLYGLSQDQVWCYSRCLHEGVGKLRWLVSRHYDDKRLEAEQGFWNCPCVPMRERKVDNSHSNQIVSRIVVCIYTREGLYQCPFSYNNFSRCIAGIGAFPHFGPPSKGNAEDLLKRRNLCVD